MLFEFVKYCYSLNTTLRHLETNRNITILQITCNKYYCLIILVYQQFFKFFFKKLKRVVKKKKKHLIFFKRLNFRLFFKKNFR
jgi:hypothetical protein